MQVVTQTCWCVCVCVHACVCVCMCMHACMCIYVHVCMCENATSRRKSRQRLILHDSSEELSFPMSWETAGPQYGCDVAYCCMSPLVTWQLSRPCMTAMSPTVSMYGRSGNYVTMRSSYFVNLTRSWLEVRLKLLHRYAGKPNVVC